MAMSVTVLCPNGRRVLVKVTPNSSILQIIEDACRKENFDPDEYDLKHLHRILDTSNTVRYSNIPNKSQLELVKCAVARTASNVTVNIATDAGLRLVHDFPANTTLWEILSHHEQQGNKELIPREEDDHEPVIVYTMRRISGHQLKTTTLKSLGLTGGKCMLRHSFQKTSSSGQAHVSAPLSRPKPPKEDMNVQVQQVSRNDLVPNLLQQPVQVDPPALPPVVPSQPQRQMHYPPESAYNIQVHHSPPADVTIAESPDVITSTRDRVPDVVQPQNGVLQPDIVADKGSHSHLPMPMDILEGHDASSSCSYLPDEESEPLQCEENVIKLGSHDAILFNMDDAPPAEFYVDEDEGFFQLTVDEVKSLYREQQKILRSFDDAPLMTKQMRELEESSKVLSALNQFPVTQLRIYFPDNNVIQGSFKPTETVAVVIDFIKQFLSNPNCEFSLVMRHPPRTLSPEISLVAADCVPNARLYFSSSSSSPYLNDETLAKKSSFNSACCTLRSRRSRRPMTTVEPYEENAMVSSNQADATAGASNYEAGYQKRTSTNMHTTGAVKKVPKWFKTGK